MNQRVILITAAAVCCATSYTVGRISIQAAKSDESLPTASTNARLGPRAARGDPYQANSSHKGLRDAGPDETKEVLAKSPLARAKTILEMANPLDRTEAWLRFLNSLEPDDFTEVADFLYAKRRTRAVAGSDINMLFNAWANCDPQAALGHRLSEGPSGETVRTAWATKDPEAAIRCFEGEVQSGGSEGFMVAFISGVAVNDPSRATELISQLPSSQARSRALYRVQPHYINQGPQAARDWALGFEDELLRDDAVVRVAKSLSMTDPKGTADWLVEMSPNVAKRAMSDIMERMAIEDPQAATDYLGTISDPVVKSRALAGIVAHVATSDPQQAFDLIDANAGTANDEIWTSLYYRTNHQNYEIRTNAIARIQNLEVKSNMLTQHLSRWLRSDFEAATHWLDQNEVPAQVREAMEERSKRIQEQNN